MSANDVSYYLLVYSSITLAAASLPAIITGIRKSELIGIPIVAVCLFVLMLIAVIVDKFTEVDKPYRISECIASCRGIGLRALGIHPSTEHGSCLCALDESNGIFLLPEEGIDG